MLMRRSGIGCGCLMDNGVLTVVGMQGLFAGAVSVGLAYRDGYHSRYSQMSSTVAAYTNADTVIFNLPKWTDQLIALAVCFGVALVGGVLLGLILLCSASDRFSTHFHDEVYWSIENS